MFYDLHIHSGLSPCANDDMSPNNIAGMAMLKGLQLIAVTDHNSLKQQRVMAAAAKQYGLSYVYGVEVQTLEEVHVLAYFKQINDAEQFQDWLAQRLLPIKNDVQYFGHQYLFDLEDQVIGNEEVLLLQSVMADIDETMMAIHEHHGLAVLAHVLDRSNSITTQLGFIPETLQFDGIEIKHPTDYQRVMAMHPWISSQVFWLCDSDAHQLVDISEAEHAVDLGVLEAVWRKYL